MADENKKVTENLKRREILLSRRGSFEQHWDDLTQVMLTRREGFQTTNVDGDQRNEDIFDGTPMQGARSLANTTGAMIRPEGEVFATIKAENKQIGSRDDAGAWLADATERFDAAIRNPKARFRQSTGEVDLDLVVLGTGILYNGLAKSRQNLLFQSESLKNGVPFFDEEGHAVGMYRTKTYQLWQLVNRFGLNKLHPDTQDLVKQNKLDEKIVVIHAVVPRDQQKFVNPLLARNMPWEELWIELEKTHLIQEGGFQEFPFIVPRWNTASGEDYGRSPGMIALPDANTLQAMGETILVAGQRSADPPLMAPDDGSFSEVNTFPGGISYYDVETAVSLRGNPFFPLISGANLPISRDMQMDSRTQVMNAFFKNILNLPINGPQMTATEIIQRKDEFIREVGPVFGIFETDYNRPIAERSFNVMLRNGGFAPIPDVLQGQQIKFEFELPVTKIRKQVMAAAARQWALEQLELAQDDPTHRHIVNKEALARFSHDALGIPHEIIRGKDEYQKLVNDDLEAAAKQAQAEEIAQGAGVAATGAKAMKDLSALAPDEQQGELQEA